ncbi:hypothetical protein BDW22DRAFT_1355722, partial [Trametopsis cervina]
MVRGLRYTQVIFIAQSSLRATLSDPSMSSVVHVIKTSDAHRVYHASTKDPGLAQTVLRSTSRSTSYAFTAG